MSRKIEIEDDGKADGSIITIGREINKSEKSSQSSKHEMNKSHQSSEEYLDLNTLLQVGELTEHKYSQIKIDRGETKKAIYQIEEELEEQSPGASQNQRVKISQ